MMAQQDDGHRDGSFAEDMGLITRRRAMLAGLATVGLGAVAWTVLGRPGNAEPTLTGTAADGGVCIKLPEETAGPFPADGTNTRAGQTVNALAETGIERADIRPSFDGLTVDEQGVPLTLEITLVDVGAACAPLSGLAVYLWHCNAQGKYSLYNIEESNALRGLQRSDSAGKLRFQTIYPGAYDGRWPHIHFEVFASAQAAVNGHDALLTSQFALPEDVSAQVYKDPRYGSSSDNLAKGSIAGDNVFGDNTPEQIAAQTPVVTGDPVNGYTATVTVAIRV